MIKINNVIPNKDRNNLSVFMAFASIDLDPAPTALCTLPLELHNVRSIVLFLVQIPVQGHLIIVHKNAFARNVYHLFLYMWTLSQIILQYL
jgi:hypothetical protein